MFFPYKILDGIIRMDLTIKILVSGLIVLNSKDLIIGNIISTIKEIFNTFLLRIYSNTKIIQPVLLFLSQEILLKIIMSQYLLEVL